MKDLLPTPTPQKCVSWQSADLFLYLCIDLKHKALSTFTVLGHCKDCICKMSKNFLSLLLFFFFPCSSPSPPSFSLSPPLPPPPPSSFPISSELNIAFTLNWGLHDPRISPACLSATVHAHNTGKQVWRMSCQSIMPILAVAYASRHNILGIFFTNIYHYNMSLSRSLY